jgi:hypothetical protein
MFAMAPQQTPGLANQSSPRDSEKRLLRVGRLAVGGIILGAFLGMLLGTGIGTMVGWWQRTLIRGLDGALLGGLSMAVLGGIYGIFLALTEKNLPEKNKETFPRLEEKPQDDSHKLAAR